MSTGKTTVQLPFNRSRKKSHSNSTSTDPSDRELSRDHSPQTPRRKKLNFENSTRKNVTKSSGLKLKKSPVAGVKFRIKSKLKIPFSYDKVIKQKTVKIINAKSNIDEIKRVEITTGHGLSVPICEGEEIVSIIIIDHNFHQKINKLFVWGIFLIMNVLR